MQSAYPNIYFPLNLCKYGLSIGSTLEKLRKGEIPPISVVQVAPRDNTSGSRVLSPPFYLVKHEINVPVPKGYGHICHVELRKVSHFKTAHVINENDEIDVKLIK